MGSARRAIRILAQLQLAEAHGQRVDEQQAPNERFARAENQLDRLSRLHYADETGQDAEHSAFCA